MKIRTESIYWENIKPVLYNTNYGDVMYSTINYRISDITMVEILSHISQVKTSFSNFMLIGGYLKEKSFEI